MRVLALLGPKTIFLASISHSLDFGGGNKGAATIDTKTLSLTVCVRGNSCPPYFGVAAPLAVILEKDSHHDCMQFL